MTAETSRTVQPPVLSSLRAATKEVHHRIEDALHIITRLSDPAQRRGIIKRYAAFHIPADVALRPHLQELADLDFSTRSRAGQLASYIDYNSLPAFPMPQCQAEALGMLYVLEGSTLGGRLILRALAARGIVDPALEFLDPYGAATGARWRDFLTVLSRELSADSCLIEAACDGAVRGFLHAETILCGGQR